jgi:hypothetical protein
MARTQTAGGSGSGRDGPKDGEVVGWDRPADLNQPLHDAYPRPGTPEPLTMLNFYGTGGANGADWIRAWALGCCRNLRAGVRLLMYLELARASVRKNYK